MAFYWKSKAVKFALLTTLVLLSAVFLINNSIVSHGRQNIIPAGSFAGAHTAIVPGAYVDPDGRLCDMLADRVSTAVELYKEGKVKKLLLTGDHGKSSYDEVNSMRKYAEARGVPNSDIFMDHAGFSTYDSMYRARDVFQVDSAVIVTQDFHLPRAVYTARRLGLQATGISADRDDYPGVEINHLREVPARVKAFLQLAAGSKPRFLGPAIAITGDGRASHDFAAATAAPGKSQLIDRNGKTIRERINPPAGFTRVKAADGSFGQYLRDLPLKPPGSKVKYYNGSVKPGKVYEAVVDLDVGDRDLQQCADAVIRLRAEYLYGKGLYDRIRFNFTNGFNADYATWRQGNRIVVEGNRAYWVKRTGTSGDYGSFRQYLDMVFAYAGTLSLAGEMKKAPLAEMKIGDVFLKGEDPGHCVMVVDMAENSVTGEKIFMLAQSYMPAQDIHILKNPRNEEISPWYPLNFGDTLSTPEWIFNKNQLVRFPES